MPSQFKRLSLLLCIVGLTAAISRNGLCSERDKAKLLNDDFCDCNDDELTTSACSYFSNEKFLCSDHIHFIERIYLSRVNDGICDCCDGSDEANVACPNICEQRGIKLSERKKSEESARAAGLALKSQIIAKSNNDLQDTKAIVENSNVLMPQLEREIQATKSTLTKEEQLERDEKQSFSIEAEKQLSQAAAGMTADQLVLAVASLALSSGEDIAEKILVHCEEKYTLPGDDPDDSEAILLAMGQDDEVRTGEQEAVAVGASPEATKRPQVVAMAAALALGRLEKPLLLELLPLVLSGGRVDAGPDPLGGDAQTTDDSPSKRGSSGGQSKKQEGVAGGSEEGKGGLQHVASVLRAMEGLGLPHETVWLLNTTASLLVQSVDYHRPQVEQLRTQKAEAEKKLKRFKQDLVDAKRLLKINYGPNNELYSLRERCFFLSDKGYQYEVCMFGTAKQQGTTILGRYEKYEVVDVPQSAAETELGVGEAKAIRLVYLHGQRCLGTATKHERSLVVELRCSGDQEEPKLVEVLEPEACAYTATLLTPLACF